MCLEIKRIRHLNGKAKVAKRNIPCLKVLYVRFNNTFMTPYMGVLIERDAVINGLFADEFTQKTMSPLIEQGIYSYKPTYPIITSAGEIIVKAYIPKGTKYWIGKGGVYVSECIKFN